MRLLAESKPELELVGEACSAEETLQLVAKHNPDVLVLDLWLGEDDGLETLRTLRREDSPVRVLVYSMNDEALYGLRSIQAGAEGYLTKDRALRNSPGPSQKSCPESTTSLNLSREKIIDTSIKGTRTRSKDEPLPLRTLTDRELHILRLIGRGISTGDIAQTLGVSPKTIGAHREHLKSKLGAGSAQELIRLAVSYVEQHAI